MATTYNVGTQKAYLSHQQSKIVFCNGVNSSIEEVKTQAVFLSKTLGDRRIKGFYNPTSLDLCTKFDDAQKEREATLGAQLAEIIEKEVGPKKGNKLTLIAHSHGAVITKIALIIVSSKLSESEKKQLRAYTLGGAQMIPKHLASDVKNYVFDGDIIAITANKAYDPEDILEKVMQIAERMRKYHTTLPTAIIEQFKIDTYASLNPFRPHSAHSAVDPEQSLRFVMGFWVGDKTAFQHPDTEQALNRYISFFTDYNIELLASPSDSVTESSDSLDPKLMLERAVTEMTGYGSRTDVLSHKVPAFEAILQDINDA